MKTIYTAGDIEQIAYGITDLHNLFQAWAAIGEGIESIRNGDFCAEHATMFSATFDAARKLDAELSKLDTLAEDGRQVAAKDNPPAVTMPDGAQPTGFLGALQAYRKAKDWDDREQQDNDDAFRARRNAAREVYATPSADTVDLLHKMAVFQDEEFHVIGDGSTSQHVEQLRAIFDDVRSVCPPLGHRAVDCTGLENLFIDLGHVERTVEALSDSDHLDSQLSGAFNLIARELRRIDSELREVTFGREG